MVRRIAITGPESTGKSTLSKTLADIYHADWVAEYSREYLKKLQRSYNQDDILSIAKGQIHSENLAAANARNFLFCDTDLLVTKIWSEVKYGSCNPWILENLSLHPYDLYLLCDIDLPWIPDPLREHPHMRKELFERYIKDLQLYNFPFAVVSGDGNERIQNAKRIIDEYFIHTPLVSK